MKRVIVMILAAFAIISCGPQEDNITTSSALNFTYPVGNGGGYLSYNTDITIQGTASFASGSVATVYVVTNNKTNQASGTSAWSFNCRYAVGTTNTVSAYAVSDKGEVLPSVSITIVVTTYSTTGDAEFEALFDNTKIHKITVEVSLAEFNNLLNDFDKSPGHGINPFGYSSSGKSEVKRKVNFILNLNGTAPDVRLNNSGFKLSGNTSRIRPYDGNMQRAHFVLDFNYAFDKNEAYYSGSADIPTDTNNSGRRLFNSLRGLKLKMNHKDPNMTLETFCYDLFRQAGVPAPRTTYAYLYIRIYDGGLTNSYNFGLYKVIESIDKSFLKRNFGKVSTDPEYGELYKCLWQDYQNGANLTLNSLSAGSYSGNPKPPYGEEDSEPASGMVYRPTYDLKNLDARNPATAYARFCSFVTNLNQKTGSDFKTWIDANFDVQTFLKFVAVNTLVGMTDDYWANANNYYLYYNQVSSKWVFIPYDYDNTFGILDIGGALSKHIDSFGPTDGSRPLINKIMAITEYKNQYHSYLSNYMKDYFTIAKANSFMNIRYQFNTSWDAVSLPTLDMDFDYVGYISNRIISVAGDLGISSSHFFSGSSGGGVVNTNYASKSDPVGDELLNYPSDASYVGNLADITNVSVRSINNKLEFTIKMKDLIRSWSGAYGYDHTCITIFLRKKDSTSSRLGFNLWNETSSSLYYTVNSQGWDYAMVASLNGAALFGNQSNILSTSESIVGDTNTKTITISLSGGYMGITDGDFSGWKYVIFSQDWNDGGGGQYPSGKLGGYRSVANSSAQWSWSVSDGTFDTETMIVDMVGSSSGNTCTNRNVAMPDSEWITLTPQ